MPTAGTPKQTIRVDPTLWVRFGVAVGDRAAALRAFMRWYLREPGAKLPKRPDSIPQTADTDQAIDPGPSPM
jgi:hypothetical protein